MRRLAGLSRAVALTFLASACGCAPRVAVAPAAAILPLTTLRLYETGVGYFERSGTLTPGERTALPVPASHLDDALASLVVLASGPQDRRGGPIRALSFDSTLSRGMARAMAGLPTTDGPIGYLDLLASLKGAHVAIRMGADSVTGRIIDVEGHEEAKPATEASLRLVVVTDRGELVRVAASTVTSLRPTDAAYAARLDAALDALSTRAARTPRMIDLLGGGQGPVTLAYVAETPVWRTTYRIVLGAGDGPPTIQGWALVHNDTDEDWHGVKVELVNGRPDSFLFPLAAPRYARRRLVHPDDALATVPQLLADTADGIWGDNVGDAAGEGLGLSGIGEGGGGLGSGHGYGRIGHGAVSGSHTGSSNVLDVGDLAQLARAAGTEAGALFVYALPDRLALHAHASALVPFVDQAVDAAPIAWVDDPADGAQMAVRFVNSTPQTLPSGTVTFYAGGGFAGESGLDRLKPGERRFVRFGTDLDVNVTVSPGGSPATDDVQRLTYTGGRISEHFLRRASTTYAFENRSGQPRTVYLALHIDRNASVTGADGVDFDTDKGTPLAIVQVSAKTRVERAIRTLEGLSTDHAVGSLTSDELAKLAGAPALAPADKAVALDALARRRELDETRHAKGQATTDLDAIEKELGRLREDMKALGSDHGAAPPPFVRRLLAAEERHDLLRTTIEKLTADEKTRLDSVEAALAKLTR